MKSVRMWLGLLLFCFVLPLTAAEPKDGFSVEFELDVSGITRGEWLFRYGPLDVSVRMAGEEEWLRYYDRAHGNYLNFRRPDGTCPVVEATLAPLGARVGLPLAFLGWQDGVKTFAVVWDGLRLSLTADGHLDQEYPCVISANAALAKTTIGWMKFPEEKVVSARIRKHVLSLPAKNGLLPAIGDSRPIAGPVQYWTPSDHNAWVGDVVVGAWKDRFHVFYLFDRRHHGSGGNGGRHFFAHLSSPDLRSWSEHPPAATLDDWWESHGTGTPFVYDGKFCLAYGLHSMRYAPLDVLISARKTTDLPPDRRQDGKFFHRDIPNAIPNGGTYAESEDGIHFRKTGLYVTSDENPSIFNNESDGSLCIGTANGQIYRSETGRLGDWKPYGKPAQTAGDCPCPFVWGDREYILQGFLGMSSRVKGGEWEDWVASGDEIYDGLGVPMVCNWKGRRIYVGWLGHVCGWGGWLVFRELVRFPDGKLGMKWLAETPPPGEVDAYDVTDLTKPFILRFDPKADGESVEFRVDPSLGRAQFAFPKKGEEGTRSQTAREIVAATPGMSRIERQFKPGNFAWRCGPVAIERIRGLDRPFKIRVAKYYDRKSDVTIFDVEIAGSRCLVTRRSGQYAKAVR